MKPIPSDILAEFETLLKKKAVPAARHADYRKWLMYYLDFLSSHLYQKNSFKKPACPLYFFALRLKGKAYLL
jgi:hypothetical protein